MQNTLHKATQQRCSGHVVPGGFRRPRTAAVWGRTALPCCLILLIAGCGGGHEASVSGRVTLDGKALETGTVTFRPEGDGPTAYGGIHPDGTYQLKTGTQQGLPPGDYQVTVMATTDPPTGGPSVPGEMITPARYADPRQSGLRYTVNPGANRIDVELTSQ